MCRLSTCLKRLGFYRRCRALKGGLAGGGQLTAVIGDIFPTPDPVLPLINAAGSGRARGRVICMATRMSPIRCWPAPGARLALRDGTMPFILLHPLGSQHCCRDVVMPSLCLGAQSPKSDRLVNDLRCAGSDPHNWQLVPQIFSWFAWEGMGEFVIDRARSAVLNGPHVRPALRLRVVGANSPELISRIPCSQCYR